MAWTNIPDDVLEPGKPIRSVDAIALRDNPIALAQGLPGAPRIQTPAIQDASVTAIKLATGTPELDWVLNRTAGAAVGAVGTYAFLRPTLTTDYAAGATLSGSSLRYSSAITDAIGGTGGVAVSLDGGTPSGTWRCMGDRRVRASNESGHRISSSSSAATLWLRIS